MKDEVIKENEWNNRPDRRPKAMRARIIARLEKEGLITTSELRQHFRGRWLTDGDLMCMKAEGLIERPKQCIRIPESTLTGPRQAVYRKEIIEQIETVLKCRNQGMTYSQIKAAILKKGKLPGIPKKEIYGKASDKKQTAGPGRPRKDSKEVGR